ncbi:hypothetical protein C8N32_108143 [Rhodovulum imhoffii]|uniref:DUF1489 family protein n=1 Tax=Rhodovulum imhoffii TaxID=365340 RepID=A0A2T5BSH1_9RHOB|nr:DUF1489 domain-containing protein [Rhodovulum imhoffii]MBK5934767.1 lysophospholipase [Rhodovulum imhoffii]PTN02191.1 hypothetical protein C8N32_108143 [Rhodovulum imhoffii]
MESYINIVKLCVGAESLEDLRDWQAAPRARGPDGLPRHVTRMHPRREEALLSGGSLYWVIRGVILVRQRVLRLDPVQGQDGIVRCGIVLDPDLVRTRPQPRRPFQGWRYLAPADAPEDLPDDAGGDDLPPALAAALAEIGVR